MKRIVGIILFLNFFVSVAMDAQELLTLMDSCYVYLERNDRVSFDKSYVRLLEAYEKEYDAELYTIKKELTEMRTKDQGIRLLLMDAQQKGKPVDGIRAMMDSIDSMNARRAAEIIDQYGWLSSDDIGHEANEALFLCLQHSQDSLLQHKYLPVLKEAVRRKAAEGWQYAFLTDRILMNQGKEQIYGTQRVRRKGIYYLVPVQNVNQIDRLRNEMELEPLDEYMNDAGLDEPWTIDYYKANIEMHRAVFKSWYDKQAKSR